MSTPSLTIRRLNPTTDTALYQAAWQWSLGAPRWLRDCAKVWEAADKTSYLAAAYDSNRIDVGVFNPEFTGMVTVVLRSKGVYEAYLAAARGTTLEDLGAAINDVYRTLISHGMRQSFVWVAARNRAIMQLCEGVGFERTGVELWKGQSHGHPIHWRQLAINGVSH